MDPNYEENGNTKIYMQSYKIEEKELNGQNGI